MGTSFVYLFLTRKFSFGIKQKRYPFQTKKNTNKSSSKDLPESKSFEELLIFNNGRQKRYSHSIVEGGFEEMS